MKRKLLHLAVASLVMTTSLQAANMSALESTLSTLKAANDELVPFTLPNGMVCLLKEDHTAPVVSVQI